MLREDDIGTIALFIIELYIFQVALARQVRAGVHDRFGIWLVPEPVLVGLEL